MSWRLAWACLVMAVGMAMSPASAQTCSVGTGSANSLNFGVVNPLLATDATTSATIRVRCTGAVLLLPAIRACFSLGLGNTSTSIADRQLGAGSHRLRYNLYTNAQYSTVWGAATANSPTSVYDVALLIALGVNEVTAALTMYGKLPGNQPTVSTVSNSNTLYQETYAGTMRVDIGFGLLGLVGDCPLSVVNRTILIPFTVSATVQKDCSIQAQDLVFPAQSVLQTAVTANSTITVRCTNNNAYAVSLSGGLHGSGPNNRKMKHATAADTVDYQLYLDGGHQQVWGDGSGGTLRRQGTGSGANQSLTVYGRIPAQATPRAGNYADTITAVVEF